METLRRGTRIKGFLAILAALGAVATAPAKAADRSRAPDASRVKVTVHQAAPGGAVRCRVATPGPVDYDGNLVRNPHVRRNLEALRCGLTQEGFGPGVVDLIVSGGESYVGGRGRVFSMSNHDRITPRKRTSAHNLENGARAVDIWRDADIPEKTFYRVLARYTAFVSPRGHGRQHWHLRLPGRQWDCPRAVCKFDRTGGAARIGGIDVGTGMPRYAPPARSDG